MQGTESSANGLFSILVIAINKKIVKIKVGFLKFQGNYLHNSLFSNSYNNWPN